MIRDMTRCGQDVTKVTKKVTRCGMDVTNDKRCDNAT